MKTEIIQLDPIRVYSSTRMPTIRTSDPKLAQCIEWADTLAPTAWKIVSANRSKAYGMHSCFYMGYEQGPSDMATLLRLHRFKAECERTDPFFGWHANFALTHYGLKGYTGGFFQQWDGSYHRGCHTLDYTRGTLPEVLERFRAWCKAGPCQYVTREVHLDKRCVWAREP